MPHRCLAGRLILLVEDEPVIALDVEKALREAGARVVRAGYLESGLYTTVHPDLSAAVVDLHLGDGSGTMICRELQRLSVPFVIHTGYPHMLTAGEWPGTAVISKPAPTEQMSARSRGCWTSGSRAPCRRLAYFGRPVRSFSFAC